MKSSRAFRQLEDWKRCEEKVLGPCAEETDQCCAVVSCELCLFIEEYGEPDLFSKAIFDGEFYIGEIDGLDFVGYWERRYDDCYFVVEIDEVEIYSRLKCEADYGEDGISCRDPGDEAALPDGRLLKWERSEKLELPHHKIGIESCRSDIVFIVDINTQAQAALNDFKSAASLIVEQIKAQSDTFRLGLVTFTTPTDTPVVRQVMSRNNDVEWLTAVAGLSTEGNDGAIDYRERKSHTALQMVADSEAGKYLKRNEKYAVLISQGYPQDQTEMGDISLILEQLTAAEQLASDDVTVHTVSLPGGTPIGFNPQYITWQRTTALNGKHWEVIPSTILGRNQFEEIFENEFDPFCKIDRPKCKEPFCGTCTCVYPTLCVTISGPNCNQKFIAVADEFEDGDKCNTRQPKWYIDVECGELVLKGDIVLSRQIYTGECELYFPGVEEPVPISGCNPLMAASEITVGYDTYTISVESVPCGNCGQRVCEIGECPSWTMDLNTMEDPAGNSPPQPTGEVSPRVAIWYPVNGDELGGDGADARSEIAKSVKFEGFAALTPGNTALDVRDLKPPFDFSLGSELSGEAFCCIHTLGMVATINLPSITPIGTAETSAFTLRVRFVNGVNIECGLTNISGSPTTFLTIDQAASGRVSASTAGTGAGAYVIVLSPPDPADGSRLLSVSGAGISVFDVIPPDLPTLEDPVAITIGDSRATNPLVLRKSVHVTSVDIGNVL